MCNESVNIINSYCFKSISETNAFLVTMFPSLSLHMHTQAHCSIYGVEASKLWHTIVFAGAMTRY